MNIFIYNEIYKYNSQSHVCCFHLLVRAHWISLDRQVWTIKINVCLVFVLCRMIWFFFWQFLRLVCVGFHYMYTQCIYNNYIYTHNYHECFFLLSLSPFTCLSSLYVFTSYSGDQIPNCGEAVEIHPVHRPPSAAKTTIFCWLNSMKHEFRVVVLKWGIPKTMGFSEFRMIWGSWRMFRSKRGPPVINWSIYAHLQICSIYHKPVSGGLTLLLPFTSRIFFTPRIGSGRQFFRLGYGHQQVLNLHFCSFKLKLVFGRSRSLDTSD